MHLLDIMEIRSILCAFHLNLYLFKKSEICIPVFILLVSFMFLVCIHIIYFVSGLKGADFLDSSYQIQFMYVYIYIHVNVYIYIHVNLYVYREYIRVNLKTTKYQKHNWLSYMYVYTSNQLLTTLNC